MHTAWSPSNKGNYEVDGDVGEVVLPLGVLWLLLGSCSEGGFFRARMKFPKDYPEMPPDLRFVSPFWHPNVYEDGRVCISILHKPGDDEYGYESASERWLPVHTVESILVSVISMITSPNLESPANVEAAKEYRDDRAGFRKKVARLVRRSQEEL